MVGRELDWSYRYSGHQGQVCMKETSKQVYAAHELFQSQYRMCLEQADAVKNCHDNVSLQVAMYDAAF